MIRRSSIRKKRLKPRRGELTKAEKEQARSTIYELSDGRCELNFPGCDRSVLPRDGSIFERWHLVHVHARRRFGWPTTGPERMRGGCYSCHILQMHNKGVKPDPLPIGE